MTQREPQVMLLDPKSKGMHACLISKVGWAMANYGYIFPNAQEQERYTALLKGENPRTQSPQIESEPSDTRPEPAETPDVEQGELVKPVAPRRKQPPPVSARMIPEP